MDLIPCFAGLPTHVQLRVELRIEHDRGKDIDIETSFPVFVVLSTVLSFETGLCRRVPRQTIFGTRL